MRPNRSTCLTNNIIHVNFITVLKLRKPDLTSTQNYKLTQNALAKHFEAHFKSPTNSPPIPETLSNPTKEITDELRKLSEDFPIDNTIPTNVRFEKLY